MIKLTRYKMGAEAGMVILKEIRRLRRRRKEMRQLTFNEVAAQLNSQGYTAANGQPFTGNSVRGILHRQKHTRRK